VFPVPEAAGQETAAVLQSVFRGVWPGAPRGESAGPADSGGMGVHQGRPPG